MQTFAVEAAPESRQRGESLSLIWSFSASGRSGGTMAAAEMNAIREGRTSSWRLKNHASNYKATRIAGIACGDQSEWNGWRCSLDLRPPMN